MSTRAAGGGPGSGTLIASEQTTGFQADDSRYIPYHKRKDVAASVAHKELNKDAKTSKGKSKSKFGLGAAAPTSSLTGGAGAPHTTAPLTKAPGPRCLL